MLIIRYGDLWAWLVFFWLAGCQVFTIATLSIWFIDWLDKKLAKTRKLKFENWLDNQEKAKAKARFPWLDK